jgi:aminoglycoside phosphotransferase (APT) family kinase protein
MERAPEESSDVRYRRAVEQELSRWLDRDDLVIEPISGGASNLTYRVRSGDDDWILRRPPAFVTATSNDMKREWTVLEALAATDVPVPRVVRTCEDPDVLGAPFYLMERLDGVVYRSPADVADLTVEQAAACRDELVDVLARLHAVDPDAVGLGSFGRPAGYLERQVGRWRKQWEATKFDEVPEIDEVLSRLGRSLPPESAAALVHGDYSFNNTLFRTTELVGILDWELATLGDPLADLGFLLLYWGPVTKATFAVVPANHGNDGFGTTTDVAERYAATSGRDLEHLDFYVALATVKMAVITAGGRRRVVDTDPDRARHLEGTTRALAAAALEATGRLTAR